MASDCVALSSVGNLRCLFRGKRVSGLGLGREARFLSGLVLVPKPWHNTHARQNERWAEEVSGELGLGWLRP